VGALSVHLVNGIWGTAAVGLFATEGGLFFGGGSARLLTQLAGIGAIAVLVSACSFVAWLALKLTIGIRVSAAEEFEGLDVGEHGMEAYPGFVQGAPEALAATTQRTREEFASASAPVRA
jgi:Amt family ammonium transporter